MSEQTSTERAIFLVVLQHILIPSPNNFLEMFEQETSTSASSYVFPPPPPPPPPLDETLSPYTIVCVNS